jgi:hypothetical protein
LKGQVQAGRPSSEIGKNPRQDRSAAEPQRCQPRLCRISIRSLCVTLRCAPRGISDCVPTLPSAN